MDRQPDIVAGESKEPKAPTLIRHEPGVAMIPAINWSGMTALFMKEVRRFVKVQLQTIWGPAISVILYLTIFTVAMGRGGRMVLGVPFADFVAPGLIAMGMLNASFANASFSLMVAKIQGTIGDYLTPPFSMGEVLAALVGAALARGAAVGLAVWGAMALWPGVNVTPVHLWAVVAFGLLGTMLLAFLGVLVSIWAEKFDHNAAVTNFIITPLTLLSGTFYAITALSPPFQAISHANPFFYVISGFRYGFVAAADTDVTRGVVILVLCNIALGVLCYRLLINGWKIKS